MTDDEEDHPTAGQLEGRERMAAYMEARQCLDSIAVAVALDTQAATHVRRQVVEQWILAFGRVVDAEDALTVWLKDTNSSVARELIDDNREAARARERLAARLDVLLMELRQDPG